MTKGRRGEWTYRVAFAHQLVNLTVGMGSSGGRQSDSLFLCRTSRHCGSDWGGKGMRGGEDRVKNTRSSADEGL